MRPPLLTILASLSILAVIISLYSVFSLKNHSNQANTQIGFVDFQAVLQQCAAGKSLAVYLTPRQQALKKAAEEKIQVLKAEQEEIAKLPSDKAIIETAALQKKIADWNVEAQKQEAELTKSVDPIVQKIRNAMIESLNEIAQENKLSAVLPLQEAVYVTKGLDLTSETIRRVDKSLPESQIKFKAAH